MTGFIRMPLEGPKRCTINIAHIRYFKQEDCKVYFFLTTPSGINTPHILIRVFASEDLARDYYNKLTEYLEITI